MNKTQKLLRKIGHRCFRVCQKRALGIPEHSRKRTYRAPHKHCPICGKTRRAGYFEACRDCLHLVEVRENVTRVIMQLGSMAQKRGYILDYDFAGYSIIIKARVTKAVQSVDGFGEPTPRGKLYNGYGNVMLSLHDLYHSVDIKRPILTAVLELLERLERKAQESIDCKGRVVEVAGMVVPCAGRWKI